MKYTLQILLQLIDQSKLWTNENFNKLLPIILVYLRYGLIFNAQNFVNDLQPSPIVQWEHLSKLDIAPKVSKIKIFHNINFLGDNLYYKSIFLLLD